MGIRDMLLCYLSKLILRADGYQAKTMCGNIQFYSGLKSGIRGSPKLLVTGRRRGSSWRTITQTDRRDVSIMGVRNQIETDNVGEAEDALVGKPGG